MAHDNLYETAITCFTESIKALGPDEVAKHKQPALYYLSFGLLRMAEGLLQQNRETEKRLIDLEAKLRTPR